MNILKMGKTLFLSLIFTSLLCLPLHAQVQEEEHSVIVLGSGLGALTAATYLCRAGIVPIVITGPVLGGTITQSHQVENWPGEISISGVELSEKVRAQAEANGADLRSEIVVAVDFSQQPYSITTKKVFGGREVLKQYKTRACIIALGATANLLDIPGEGEYWSRGVHNCAACDGTFYRDKVVAVAGGGDAALIEAQYLANIASKVYLIVRGGQFRTVEKQRMEEVLSHPKIEVRYHTIVKQVKGDGQKVAQLIIEESNRAEELPVDALFLAIGSQPNTKLFEGQVELDPKGYVVLKKHQQTSKEGVYAIGDVADPEFKQAISAAGDAAKAALQAQQYIALKERQTKAIAVKKHSERKEVIEIQSAGQLEQEMANAKEAVFVDFYSTHCGPCRMFGPIYEGWSKKYGDKIKFLKVNADRVPEVFERYQIRGVPTLMIFDEKGQLVRKSIGLHEISEVDKRLEKLAEGAELRVQNFRSS